MSNFENAVARIIINHRKRAIEISKTFAKKASIFGSEEYKDLKAAKEDFPTYRVVVKSATKRGLEDKLTMKDILYYVKKHSGEDSAEMKELLDLRGKSVVEAKKASAEGYRFEMEESASFFEIKKWFFAKYPDLAKKEDERKAHIQAILAGAADDAASA